MSYFYRFLEKTEPEIASLLEELEQLSLQKSERKYVSINDYFQVYGKNICVELQVIEKNEYNKNSNDRKDRLSVR